MHDRSGFTPAALLSLLLALAGSPARAVTVEQIPSPRPTGWAVDLTNTLSPERLAELSRLGEDVKAKAGAELAVVVVPSTDGADPHDFATRLFNAWGIGDRTAGNGILVFAALNDHKAEIVLGHGLDTEAGRRESQEVMQQEMIPRFRNGDPTGAVVLGSIACARRILGVSPLVEGVETPPGMAATEASAPPADGTATYTDSGGFVHPIPPAGAQPPRTFYTPPPASSGIGLTGIVWLGLLSALAGTAGYVALRTPRCSQCKQKMTMLDEQADDAYLEPSEKVEERIGSVDYQIWVCPACGERKKRRSSSFFSRYSTCPECGAKTLSSESTTIQEATYTHGGEIQVDQACANCSYKNSYVRYTAQLEERTYSSSSSSSSSSGSSFGFSSSSSPSSSSSSSSDSSSGSSSGFSGGSSSGGGASGSW
jgi:uncharacterized protein